MSPLEERGCNKNSGYARVTGEKDYIQVFEKQTLNFTKNTLFLPYFAIFIGAIFI